MDLIWKVLMDIYDLRRDETSSWPPTAKIHLASQYWGKVGSGAKRLGMSTKLLSKSAKCQVAGFRDFAEWEFYICHVKGGFVSSTNKAQFIAEYLKPHYPTQISFPVRHRWGRILYSSPGQSIAWAQKNPSILLITE